LKIIDAHLHFSNQEGLKETAREIGQVDYSGKGLVKEFKEANVVAGIVMNTPRDEWNQLDDSMWRDLKKEAPDLLFSCVGINPIRLQEDPNELIRIEKELNKSYVVGIKIYAGYFHNYVYDPVYDPIYGLARKYNIPVAIHCGDTQSPRGLLKYSHPLTIDELAVEHHDINFIICHLGVPWVMDTAELILKNPNVYTDVSGLIAGNKEHVEEMKNTKLFSDPIQQGFVYANRYDKILFGTDWPLAPIGPYVEFVQQMIPERYQEDVFYNNALKIYPKMKQIIHSHGEGRDTCLE
jgi:predicted TIM-barrel fold metal-dependent hydrolase